MSYNTIRTVDQRDMFDSFLLPIPHIYLYVSYRYSTDNPFTQIKTNIIF